MGWSALPPQNQKKDKNPSGFYHNHLPPFFEDFGGVSTSNVPSYLSFSLFHCTIMKYLGHPVRRP